MQEVKNIQEAYAILETAREGFVVYIDNFDGTVKTMRKKNGTVITKDEVRRA